MTCTGHVESVEDIMHRTFMINLSQKKNDPRVNGSAVLIDESYRNKARLICLRIVPVVE